MEGGETNTLGVLFKIFHGMGVSRQEFFGFVASGEFKQVGPAIKVLLGIQQIQISHDILNGGTKGVVKFCFFNRKHNSGNLFVEGEAGGETPELGSGVCLVRWV